MNEPEYRQHHATIAKLDGTNSVEQANTLYANTNERLNTITGSGDFLKMVKNYRDSMNLLLGTYEARMEFSNLLLSEYGIKIFWTSDGMLLTEYEIADEQKYMVFVLRYS